MMLIILFLITVIGYLSFSDFSFAESIKEVGALYGSIFYIGLVYMALGVLLSVLLKSSKGSVGMVMAVVFGTFIFGILGTVVDELRFLSYFSPMDWIKTQKL